MSNEIKIQNAITLYSTLVKKVEFDSETYNQSCTEDSLFDLKTEILFNEESSKFFAVGFTGSLKNNPNKDNFKLEVEMIAIFQTSEVIVDEFKSSPFANINAPAIAFPFFRSFIATFLTNAGFSPVILNSINFAATFNKEQSKK